MLAPWVISQFPAHAKYIEPFGGCGSILLSKPAVHAEIYNDLDSEVVNLFSVVRSQPPELLGQIKFTPYVRDAFEQSYEPCKSPLEQAKRTLVRSWMGFARGAPTPTAQFKARLGQPLLGKSKKQKKYNLKQQLSELYG